MSDEEVDELLKAVDTSSGELNYMGELLLVYERFTRRQVLTRIFRRHGQDDSRKLNCRRLDFPLLSSFLFHGMKRSLHGYWRLMACICEGIGKKDFVISEADAGASERRSLVYRPGTRWSGLVTCIQQSITETSTMYSVSTFRTMSRLLLMGYANSPKKQLSKNVIQFRSDIPCNRVLHVATFSFISTRSQLLFLLILRIFLHLLP